MISQVHTEAIEGVEDRQERCGPATGLGQLANWRIVTGPLSTLDHVWKAYGVSISVDPKTGVEAHNDVAYFIDPAGRLRFKATPFADESPTGVYSLPAATVARWAAGIAEYAQKLVPT